VAARTRRQPEARLRSFPRAIFEPSWRVSHLRGLGKRGPSLALSQCGPPEKALVNTFMHGLPWPRPRVGPIEFFDISPPPAIGRACSLWRRKASHCRRHPRPPAHIPRILARMSTRTVVGRACVGPSTFTVGQEQLVKYCRIEFGMKRVRWA
jgi:hypothetical protein